MTAPGLGLLERGLVPDWLIRRGIRRLLASRLADEAAGGPAAIEARLAARLAAWEAGPIAVHPEAANAQHYELPPAFFERVLGRRLKYSSAYWPDGVGDLDVAEEAMLELSAARAELADGQDVLELGCGWGSMTLWMAERFPASRILAVSNSAPQRRFILASAALRGLANVEVVTADVNDFTVDGLGDGDRRFDRVVSIEMLEHVRRHRELFRRLAGWVRPGGKVFVHVFCHRELTYPFEVRDGSDWMAKHFFTGGVMPGFGLLPRLAAPSFELEAQWLENGRHYAQTAEAWLARLDRRRDEVAPILAEVYGEADLGRWLVYWRVFFMACTELFAYRDGREWGVAHYRFRR